MTTALFIPDANETFSRPTYSTTPSRSSSTEIHLSGGTVCTPCRTDGGGVLEDAIPPEQNTGKKTLTPQPVLQKLRKADLNIRRIKK